MIVSLCRAGKITEAVARNRGMALTPQFPKPNLFSETLDSSSSNAIEDPAPRPFKDRRRAKKR
jgi:hypothetical protein